MAFIRLISNNLAEALSAGEAICKVSESVFQTGPDSEWAKFVVNPHDWLLKHNYCAFDKNDRKIGDGSIPRSLELVPVYDSENRMHIRIPWKQRLRDGQSTELSAEPDYQGKFNAVLAHYFMRSCR